MAGVLVETTVSLAAAAPAKAWVLYNHLTSQTLLCMRSSSVILAGRVLACEYHKHQLLRAADVSGKSNFTTQRDTTAPLDRSTNSFRLARGTCGGVEHRNTDTAEPDALCCRLLSLMLQQRGSWKRLQQQQQAMKELVLRRQHCMVPPSTKACST